MIVARVAGLPSASARVGELPDTARRLGELDALRGDLTRRGEELADLIHAAVGGCEDRAVRRALLACRRAVHNGRAPKALSEAATARLSGPARELHARLVFDHEALDRGWEEAREAYRAETSAAEQRLADLVRDENFRRALAMASDALYPDVEAWLSGPASAPEHLNTRRRVVNYVLRTALKTSPFSTLTTAGPLPDGDGAGPEGGAAETVQVQEPDRLSRHLELNAEVEFQLERLLVTGRGPLFLRTNPTLTVLGERAMVVHADGRCVGVPARPWLLALARRAEDGASPADLAGFLTSEFGAAAAEAESMLGQLVKAGLLQSDLGVPDQARDRLTDVADRLGLPEASPVRRVGEAAGEVEAADTPADRWLSLGRLRSTVGEALTEAGGDPSLIPGKYLCYEDVLPGWTTAPRTPDWSAFDRDLHRVRRLVSVFDGALPGRLAIAELLGRRFGTTARVGLMEAWLAWNEAAPANASEGAPDTVVLHALRDNPFHLTDTGVPRVEELRRFQTGLLGLLSPPDGTDPAFDADTGALDRLLDAGPDWLPQDHPTTLFLQPLADGSLAFNASAPGHETAGSRVRRWSEPPVPYEDRGGDGPLLVEVAGLFRSSLNRVAPHASHELVWPGCVPSRPPERRVRPADLEIRLDPAGVPTLWWRPADRPVELVHRGTMGRFWFPPVLRFLLDLTTPMSEAWALVGRARALYVNPKPSEVSVLPRLRVGGVLMERRSWIVPRAELDLGEGDDFERFTRVRRRVRDLGLPDVVFARAADVVDTTERVMEKAKDRKPRPLDLCSWWGVEELARLSKGRDLLLFQEAAPDVFGSGRVVEYAVELPGERR
ncbi:lantibiotic dehydratase [Nocardiopsis sp. L17-MgMaSL7]|uniref:lantibiotic dehydratase n=1 Tax=Nocardiopsis sp. L17-MgMaSL7 TaxID=1938893 RepID=UPI000D7132A9|nr:lantibiotic dehydratase [Nocardiopsis sp. L17-MgMaSL7]PWV52813.1 lantibiotic biosynthesis dehydratase-like protein [Nocardiopsis sp. L17-MgMaSL7]